MIYSSSVSHPNMFSVVSGKTMIDTAIESINRCISLLILSGFTELFGEPDFGSGIYEVQFDYVTDLYLSQLKLIICDAISKYENRVICNTDDITAEYDSVTNHIHISIGYTVKDSSVYSQTNLSVGVSL